MLSGANIRDAMLFIALIACSVMNTVLAQDKVFHLQLYNNSTIPAANINHVIKDNKGFLWIQHRRQIERFDGRTTRIYDLGVNLENMISDSKSRLWVSSRNKVFLLQEGKTEFEEVALTETANGNRLGPMVEMAGSILLMTNQGMLQFQDSSGLFNKAFPQLQIALPYSIRLLAAKGSYLFFRNDEQVFRFHTRSHQLDSLPNTEAYKLHPVTEDSVLVSSWTNKTYWYNYRNKTVSQTSLPGEKTFDIKTVASYKPGHYFLACREGVFEYNSETATYEKLQFMLDGRKIATSEYITSIFTDNDGYAWVATVDGIGRFAFRHETIGLARFKQPDNDTQGGIDNVRKITGDKKGNLWMATANGFFHWNTENNHQEMFLPFANALSHPSIKAIAYDGRKVILGPTDSGLWIFDPQNKLYSRPHYQNDTVQKQIERDFIDDIVTLHNGNLLILGRDNLYKLEAPAYTLSTVDIPVASENMNYAFQAKNGIIWLTTAQGLHCLDAEARFLQTVPLPFEDKYISSGYVLDDNRFVFATNYGVFIADYTSDGVSVHKFATAFDNIFLSTIFFDRNNILWATAENGIYRYDPLSQKLNLFDHYDNVKVNGFNDNNWYRNAEGVVFLGGRNGVAYFTPENLAPPNEELTVYLTGVTNSGKDFHYNRTTGKNVLNYSHKATLYAEFVSPFYSNPDKVKYRFRLRGFDDKWNIIGNTNIVQFTSLPPGNYTLNIQATTNGIDWVDAKNSFSFYIKPPFWFTWWFISGLLLLTGFIIWKILRVRGRQLAEQKEKIEAEQAINYFATSLQETSSVEEILWDVAKNCISRLHFEDCVIYLVDYDKKVLVQQAAYGPKMEAENTIKNPILIPLGKGITGHVAITGRAEIIEDTTKDERYIVDDAVRFSEITVPIVHKGEVLGIIDCEHSRKGFFNYNHLSILTTIASLCANKIVKAKAETEKQKAEQILLQTQRKMADVEMLALRAQMNPHFIFNCLNSINRYIVKSDQVTASLYLTKFAKLIRLILDNSNNQSITLANEMEALMLYIEMELIRFEKRFSYSVDIEENVNTGNIFVPPLIIQPYVENAIWHGLLHKKTAGELKIRIGMPSEYLLQCVIEDNGIGRDKARELRSKSVATKKSLGMKLTEDRLALLAKHSQTEATIEVEDIRTADDEAAGTKVIINIPVDY